MAARANRTAQLLEYPRNDGFVHIQAELSSEMCQVLLCMQCGTNATAACMKKRKSAAHAYSELETKNNISGRLNYSQDCVCSKSEESHGVGYVCVTFGYEF